VTGTTTKSTDLWKVGSSFRELLSGFAGRMGLGVVFALAVGGGGRGCSSGAGNGRSPLFGAGAVLAGKAETGLLGCGASGISCCCAADCVCEYADTSRMATTSRYANGLAFINNFPWPLNLRFLTPDWMTASN